jgi:hypothetical protein
VRLQRRRERLFESDMELAVVEREPCTAARAQRLGLLELLQAKQIAEEAPRFGFAARRRRDLNVV